MINQLIYAGNKIVLIVSLVVTFNRSPNQPTFQQ